MARRKKWSSPYQVGKMSKKEKAAQKAWGWLPALLVVWPFLLLIKLLELLVNLVFRKQGKKGKGE